MSTALLQSALAYYAANGAALFPIPAGQKFGRLVASFAHDWSRDPVQWEAWRAAHPNCNFGLVSGPSHLIIADVDVSEVGREAAWGYWTQWCESRGLPVYPPHVQSARGGWHIYFALPADFDVSTLRQVPLVGAIEGVSKKAIVDMRVGNGFVVAAGSYYDGTAKGEASGTYTLFGDAPPHPAPPALLANLARARSKATTSKPGTADLQDTIKAVTWMTEHGYYSSYDEWREIGMILRAEFGDDPGFEIWQITNDGTCSAQDEASKWDSFSADKGAGVGIGTLRHKSIAAKCPYKIGTSLGAMFEGVASTSAAVSQIIKDAGGTPSDSLFAGHAEFGRIATPYLVDFLAAPDCRSLPSRPANETPFPTLPDSVSGHPLYDLMNEVLERISVMIEPDQKFKAARYTQALGILRVMNLPEVYGAVTRRMAAIALQERKIKLFAEGISEEVQRVTVTLDKWEYDPKTGEIQSDNPDNVEVAIGIVGCDVRRNTWIKRTEIKGWDWPEWTAIDSAIVNALRMRMMRTKTRFRPNKEFLRDAIDNIAMRDQHNPVLELINGFVWDGRPRLATWLSETCGVPADAYHAAVGKNVIGGIVKRARKPGCKHDEVMILMGPEGVTKSGFCRALALRDDWFTDSVSFEGSPQNIIPQMFGKLVIELAELDGMTRTEAKHVKAFITRQNDNFTPKYEAVSEDNLRRSVFVGTSNETAPLVDITGNRRFLPVRIHTAANITWLKANVEQLYAEACVLENNDESFALPESIWGIAHEHQESARSVSDIEVKLVDWFAETTYTTAAFVSVPDLVDACNFSNWKNSGAMCHAIMPRLGFREARPYLDGKRTNVWVRGPEIKATHIPNLTRYNVDTSQGRVRFTIRRAAAPILPPPPY